VLAGLSVERTVISTKRAGHARRTQRLSRRLLCPSRSGSVRTDGDVRPVAFSARRRAAGRRKVEYAVLRGPAARRRVDGDPTGPGCQCVTDTRTEVCATRDGVRETRVVSSQFRLGEDRARERTLLHLNTYSRGRLSWTCRCRRGDDTPAVAQPDARGGHAASPVEEKVETPPRGNDVALGDAPNRSVGRQKDGEAGRWTSRRSAIAGQSSEPAHESVPPAWGGAALLELVARDPALASPDHVSSPPAARDVEGSRVNRVGGEPQYESERQGNRSRQTHGRRPTR
jgi:hypothetical protein